jgi:hypothetical protein
MRTQSIVNSFKAALVVAPLLASCGSTAPSSVIVDPNNALMLPDCQEGQLIGVNADKSLSCVSALAGMLSPPTCLPGTQALTSEKDPVTGTISLKCIVKGTGVNDTTTSTRITNATTNINNLQSMLTTIASGGGVRSKFIGITTAQTTGLMKTSQLTNGGPYAAAQLCEAQFGAGSGAHMCTPFEIYESVLVGNILDGSTDYGPAWAYLEGWNDPAGSKTGTAPSYYDAGLAENCGAGSYGTGDRHWKGTLFSFKNNLSNVRVPQFVSNTNCASSYPIACCK